MHAAGGLSFTHIETMARGMLQGHREEEGVVTWASWGIRRPHVAKVFLLEANRRLPSAVGGESTAIPSAGLFLP